MNKLNSDGVVFTKTPTGGLRARYFEEPFEYSRKFHIVAADEFDRYDNFDVVAKCLENACEEGRKIRIAGQVVDQWMPDDYDGTPALLREALDYYQFHAFDSSATCPIVNIKQIEVLQLD